jgi:FkbM family methyltransferase
MAIYSTKHGVIEIQGDNRMEKRLSELGEYMYTDIAVCIPYMCGTVVDVGAHVGLWSIPLARFAHKVIAIEAEHETAELLRSNLIRNALTNVVVREVLLGDPRKLYKRGNLAAPTGENYYLEGGNKQSVTLDSLINEKIEFIKIDVEGMEPEVLDGARRIINNSRPIIFLEVNPKALRKHGKTSSDIVGFLKGYRLYRFNERHGLIHVPFIQNSFHNLLAIPTDREQPSSKSFLSFILLRCMEKIGLLRV